VTEAVASADVAVVGCGVVGLATAERLVARNLSVVLIDGVGVAAGASGASGGLVRAFDPAGGSWAARGLEIYLRRGWRGRWPRVRERGSLVLVAADDAERAAEGVDRLHEAGHSAEILSAPDLHARFPGLSLPADLVGVYEDRAGWLPARDVTAAMLRDAASGTITLEAVRATAVVTSGSRVAGVETTAGRVTARAVLLAAGAGSTALAATVGVGLPLWNRAVSYCVFQPRGTGGGDLPVVVDTTTGSWMRPWDSGTAVPAGVASAMCDVPASVKPWVSVAEERRVREVVRHRDLRLIDADVVGGLTAYDALASDRRGAVTAWPEPAGLLTATGWNGGGFKLAPAIGAHAATLVRAAIG